MDAFSIIFDKSKAFMVIAEMLMIAKYPERSWHELYWVHLITWNEQLLADVFCDQINIQIEEI